jgi:hypothetical protein
LSSLAVLASTTATFSLTPAICARCVPNGHRNQQQPHTHCAAAAE